MPFPPLQSASESWSRGLTLAAVAVVAAAFLTHATGLGNGFVWDDAYYVAGNEGIRSWSHAFEHFTAPDRYLVGLDTQTWRPIRNLSYTLDHTLWGLRPFGFHLTNVLLHMVNAFGVFLLAWRLTRRHVAASLAGLLFGVHPVLSEAVAWVKGRDDLLATLFCLLAVHAFLCLVARPDRRRWVWLFLLAVLLALLSKESALCLVPSAALLWWFLRDARDPFRPGERPAGDEPVSMAVTAPGASEPRPDSGGRAGMRVGAAVLGGLALSVLYVLARTLILGRVSQTEWLTGSAWTTYLTMVRVLVYYLQLAVVPVRLTCDYSDFPVLMSCTAPGFVLSAVWLLALAGALVWARRRAPWVVFGLVWFYLCLAPVSNVVPTMQLLAERFVYLPMVGLCLAAGVGGEALQRRVGERCRVCAAALGVGVALGLVGVSCLTVARNRDWRDNAAIFSAALDVSPGNVRMRDQLAHALANKGEYARVVELLRHPAIAMEGTAKLKRSLGVSLYYTGRKEEGLAMLHAAIRQAPDMAQLYEDLGHIAVGKGALDEAARWFASSVERDPLSDARWTNLGMVHRDRGDAASARRAFEQALSLNPANVNTLRALAALAWQEERWTDCARRFQALVDLNPGDRDAGHWLREATSKALEAPPVE